MPSDGAKGETGLHEVFGIGAVSNEGTPKSGTEGKGVEMRERLPGTGTGQGVASCGQRVANSGQGVAGCVLQCPAT